VCVMALPVVSVLAEVTPAHLERITRTHSVWLETESRERVIVVSTLLSNFLTKRIPVQQ